MKKLFAAILILGVLLSAGIYWWQSRPGRHVQAREVSPQELRQMIQDENDFYVYFYSPTCKDCIKSDPKLAEALRSVQVTIVRLDVKKYEEAKEEFQVPGTPSIFYYKDHKLLRGISGGYDTAAEYLDFFGLGGGGS